jgi:hypothetical protein
MTTSPSLTGGAGFDFEDSTGQRGRSGCDGHFLLRDLRHALQGLTKDRAFAVVALLSLGLGVGLNTAVFSSIDAVLLRPFPYEDADRLAL